MVDKASRDSNVEFPDVEMLEYISCFRKQKIYVAIFTLVSLLHCLMMILIVNTAPQIVNYVILNSCAVLDYL